MRQRHGELVGGKMDFNFINTIKCLTLFELPTDEPVTVEIIRLQYRKLCLVYHPDQSNKRYKDGTKFKELTEAKDYLTNNIDAVNSQISSGFQQLSRSSSYSNQRYYAEEARRKAEEETRRRASEEARRRAEEEACRQAEEEARRRAEEARRQAEEETRRRAEEARRKAEEERRKVEEIRHFAEEARCKTEEARRRAEYESCAKEEKERRKAVEEVLRKAEEARHKGEKNTIKTTGNVEKHDNAKRSRAYEEQKFYEELFNKVKNSR